MHLVMPGKTRKKKKKKNRQKRKHVLSVMIYLKIMTRSFAVVFSGYLQIYFCEKVTKFSEDLLRRCLIFLG